MKKIYVLIVEDRPMICFEWFDQCVPIIEKYKKVNQKSFEYKKDSEKSLIDAMQNALTFCKENGANALEIPSLTELVEDYIIYYNLEGKTVVSQVKEVTKDEFEDEFDDDFDSHYSDLQINYNSELVSMMLDIIVEQKSFANAGIFTGIDPVLFYYMLIEMCYNPRRTVLSNLASRRGEPLREVLKKQSELDIEMDINKLKDDKEYKKLKERVFNGYLIYDHDFKELEARTVRYVTDNYQEDIATSYENKAFRKWLFTGKHYLVDVYNELVTNPIYSRKLLEVTGTWNNFDLKSQKSEIGVNVELTVLSENATALRNALLEKIVGQDAVIDKFEKAYFNAEKRAITSVRKKGVKHAFLFAGTPGVGKTYLAETFAEVIGLPYKRFDMAAYSRENSLEGLVGFEKTYRNAKDGVLTSFVDDNPQCVLLFDEIEKASQDVILNFLQILDEGQCIDKKRNRHVSFRDAILIFTTNAGRQLYEGAENRELSLLPEKKILNALLKDINPQTKQPYFPEAIASRFSSYTVLMFNHLGAKDLMKVAGKDVDGALEVYRNKFSVNMTGADKIAPTIMYSLGGKADARNASKKAGQFIDSEMHKFLKLISDNKSIPSTKSLKGVKWILDLENVTDEIKELYHGGKDAAIAVFADVEVEDSIILDNNHVKVVCTTNEDEFRNCIENENVLLTIIDYEYESRIKKKLNVVDCQSKGRDVFESVCAASPEFPVLLLNRVEQAYTAQECNDLQEKGCNEFVSIKENVLSAETIEEVYINVSYQNAMDRMFVKHQVLMFDTAHNIFEHTLIGEIRIHNLRLETVIDADDESEFISEDVMPNVHWDDIRVSEKLKEELKFFVRYLVNPKEFRRAGLKPPKGVLFYGPPGTGKTSLAKVVATEAGINFIAVGGDELKNGGAQKVQELFTVARKYAPSIIFIDEVDAIALDRATTGMNSALNRLLIEMDGFKKSDNKIVFVMGATNLGDEIDPALERRFDKKVEVSLPDKEDRKWLFTYFINKHKEVFSEVTEELIENLVTRSERFSPALIEKIVEAAYREAIRRNTKVTNQLLDDTFEEMRFGEARTDVEINDLKQTAIHEAGHVICDYLSTGNIPSYMSIMGRGNFNGYMIPGKEKKGHMSKQNILDKICISLGGRAAELVFFGADGMTPGISQDIKDATYYAQHMVCSWAMYADEIGMSVIDIEKIHHYPKVADLVNGILSEQMQRAITIIEEHKSDIEVFVEAIMTSPGKSLSEKEIATILQKTEE